MSQRGQRVYVETVGGAAFPTSSSVAQTPINAFNVTPWQVGGAFGGFFPVTYPNIGAGAANDTTVVISLTGLPQSVQLAAGSTGVLVGSAAVYDTVPSGLIIGLPQVVFTANQNGVPNLGGTPIPALTFLGPVNLSTPQATVTVRFYSIAGNTGATLNFQFWAVLLGQSS